PYGTGQRGPTKSITGGSHGAHTGAAGRVGRAGAIWSPRETGHEQPARPVRAPVERADRGRSPAEMRGELAGERIGGPEPAARDHQPERIACAEEGGGGTERDVGTHDLVRTQRLTDAEHRDRLGLGR